MEQQGLWERTERLRGAADEAARLVQNVYLSFLLLGMYIAIIIGSTTDMQLLKVSPVTLPLLNVQLPIVGFYVVVPWLLLLFYFNLLLHLTFLAQKLHRLNAVLAAFPDETAREEQRVRLFPFPFSAMLIGRPARWRLRRLLGLMIWTTVLLLPLVLLLWAQLRFLPYHDTAITWNHRAAVLVDLTLLWLFWPLMFIPERESPARSRRGARARHASVALRWGTGVSVLTLVTVVFSLGIAVLPEEGMERWMASHVPKGWRHVDPRPFWQGRLRAYSVYAWSPFTATCGFRSKYWSLANHPRRSLLHCGVRMRPSRRKGWTRSQDSSSPIVTYEGPIFVILSSLRQICVAPIFTGANLAGTRAFAVNFRRFFHPQGREVVLTMLNS